MYYALTINADQIITGVHESVAPILADTFAANPELADDTVVTIPTPADYQTYTHILCYNEDGTLKDLVWCIENGYMELPQNKEIINGELVDKEVPAEEQPQTLKDYLDEQFSSIRQETAPAQEQLERQEQRFVALKPIISPLLTGKTEDVVIRLKDFIEEWKQGVYVTDQSIMFEDYPFRVIAPGHDSTDNPDWNPTVRSLFAPWHGKSPDTALPWFQPIEAESSYKKGEYMIWTDGKICRSKRTTNFSPEEYPADWEYQNENGEYVDFGSVPVEPEEPNTDPEEPVELNKNGTVKWGEWVDPKGDNSKLYMKDDGVTVDGVKKVSAHDHNGNPPSVASWWTDYVV